MDTGILKIVGQVAGIGGIALGVFFLIFKEVIRKNIFPMLTKEQAYRIILIIVILTFVIAALGLVAWVYVNKHETQMKQGYEPPMSGGNKPISSEKRKLDKPPEETDPRPPSKEQEVLP